MNFGSSGLLAFSFMDPLVSSNEEGQVSPSPLLVCH